MISHEEAQALISARLDAPLDPAENRVLLGHLATCASCRQFAEQTNVLARGLRDMPQLAPSPVVSRAVLERISQGRSPWTRFWEGLKLNPAPLAAAAAVIVLLIVGVTIFRGFGDDDDNGGNLAQLDANTQTAQATEDAASDATEDTENTQAAEAPETEPANVPSSNDETEPTAEENDSQTEESTETPSEPTPVPARTSAGSSPSEPTATTSQGDDISNPGDSGAAAGVAQTGEDETGPESASGPNAAPDSTEPVAQPDAQQPDDEGQAAADEAEATEPATEEPTSDDSEDSGDEDGGSAFFVAEGPSDGSPVATPTQEGTAARPTAIVVSIPTAPSTATPTNTPEPTATEDPTSTATLEPSETPEPTNTPASTATATATVEPTATERPRATSTPEPTEAPEPTETPEPTATATAEPTETPDPTETPVPTETPEPTETATLEPTETPLPTETATPEPTETPLPTETPEPTETATPQPTETPEPTNTPEPPPTDEPAADSPPIVPREGSDVVDDGSTEPGGETAETAETTFVTPVDDGAPTPVPDADAGEPTPADDTATDVVDAAEPTPAGIGADGPDDGNASDETSPADDRTSEQDTGDDADDGGSRIQPIGETDQDGASGTDQGDTGAEDDQGDAAADADEAADDPTAEADDSDVTGVGGGPDEDGGDADASEDAGETEAFDLAEARVVIGSIPGPASPDGPLRYANGAYISGVDGGELAVVSADGAVSGLGTGYYPSWSPGGQLAYTVDDGVSAVVHLAGAGVVSAPGPEDGDAVRDVPAGWSGDAPVILRTDRDRAEYAELYVAGSGDPFWRREGIGLVGLIAVQAGGGVLVPTTEGWLLVDQGGGEQNLGPVVSGEVSAAAVGPNGLLAYLAGGSIWVGTAGNPAGAAPIATGSGFDFAPSGDRIAVTDGGSLTVYDLGGGVVASWTPGDGSAVGAPYWSAEGIVVPVGTSLRIVPTSEIGG